MKDTNIKLICLGVFCIALLAACNLPGSSPATPANDGALQTMVAATLTAASPAQTLPPASVTPQPAIPSPVEAPSGTPTATATISPTLASQANNVSGKICFPGDSIPAMTVFFQDMGNNQVMELQIAAGQTQYETYLPPGAYQAYAWLDDFSRGGLYSNAVTCGLKSGCTDHTPLKFSVSSGENSQGIDVCDWYAGPFNVPYPPGKEPGKLTGSISGSLNYPAGYAPSLHVVAFNLTTHNWYYVETNPGSAAFNIPDLPPGSYQVVAYEPDGKAGGHAQTDHSLIEVTVKAGEKTMGADITDWNAPFGSFPVDPTR